MFRSKKQKNPKPSEYPWPFTVRLPDFLDTRLRRAARKKKITRSELVRRILEKYL